MSKASLVFILHVALQVVLGSESCWLFGKPGATLFTGWSCSCPSGKWGRCVTELLRITTSKSSGSQILVHPLEQGTVLSALLFDLISSSTTTESVGVIRHHIGFFCIFGPGTIHACFWNCAQLGSGNNLYPTLCSLVCSFTSPFSQMVAV